eukprot:3832493-Amphidinium_carterae.1
MLWCDTERTCDGNAQGTTIPSNVSPQSESDVSAIWSVAPALSRECAVVANPSGTFLAVLDTGAQSTVCGSQRWAEFETKLRGHGLNAVKTESTARGTKGIGGEAKCLGIWNTPIGLGGCNGLMSVTVLEGDAPFLLSIAIGHLAVDILEFANDKWTPPLGPPAGQTDFPLCLAIPAHTWVTTELESRDECTE